MGLFDLLKKDKKNNEPENKIISNIEHKNPNIDDIRKIINEIERITVTDVLNITFSDEKPGISDSKFGGIPYVHYDSEIPKNYYDQQLRLLAQINCSELTSYSDFPEEGLIQIFIESNDKSYGLDRNSPANQKGFRIIYIPEIDRAVTEYESSIKVTPYNDDNDFPIKGEYKLIFTFGTESISIYDYRYNEIFVKNYNEHFPHVPIKNMYDMKQEFCNEIYSSAAAVKKASSKIGGYPFFFQEDPRLSLDNAKNYDALFLQIDSNRGNNRKIEWGDYGVCNFFIKGIELNKANFNDIIYNWDSL